MSRRYWNEEVETLPQAEIDRLEVERLPAQLAYMAAASDFFRAKFDQAGLAPEAVTGRDELARLPFMEKRELAAAQADGSLIGANLCARLEDVVRIQATGGTTGQPLRIAFTRQDEDDPARDGDCYYAIALDADTGETRWKSSEGAKGGGLLDEANSMQMVGTIIDRVWYQGAIGGIYKIGADMVG